MRMYAKRHTEECLQKHHWSQFSTSYRGKSCPIVYLLYASFTYLHQDVRETGTCFSPEGCKMLLSSGPGMLQRHPQHPQKKLTDFLEYQHGELVPNTHSTSCFSLNEKKTLHFGFQVLNLDQSSSLLMTLNQHYFVHGLHVCSFIHSLHIHSSLLTIQFQIYNNMNNMSVCSSPSLAPAPTALHLCHR